MSDVPVLKVLLHGKQIASLTLLPGDNTLLTFEEEYIEDQHRPTLSLGFKDNLGNLITDHKPVRTRVPPFFSNLLPEGPLREYLAKRAGVKSKREFHLLWALGEDLPGAIKIEPMNKADWPVEGNAEQNHNKREAQEQALRFSLAGVQLKFSAVAKAHGGLTIPAKGSGGDWIVKLPSATFPKVPENEYAMMELAHMLGINVPETRLVPIQEVQGLPEGMAELGGNAFAIKRFDRLEDGAAVHIEDFAQIFRVFPDKKYERASYRNIMDVVATETNDDDVTELVRRLTFNALIGNADMHLKNWSLIYPDGRNARLAPAYDFVSTIGYILDDNMALKFGNSKRFDQFNEQNIRYFASKSRLPEKFVLDTASETAASFDALWPSAKKDLPVSNAVAASIEKLRRQIPFGD